MEISFSKHAIERISARNIKKEEVNTVIKHPDAIISDNDCQKIYQKVIKKGNSEYLYRVFVNVCKSSTLIITAYKTSKIEKYEH